MAAPADMTSRDFSEKFVMNKSLCEKAQEVLEMQGHHTSASGVEHIEVDQTVPGLRASSERRVLDGAQKTVESPIFGALVVQNRRVEAEEIKVGWLKDGLLPETFVDGKVVHTRAQSDPARGGETWRVQQTWGFEVVGGAKRYVRRVYVVGAQGEAVQGRLVYDYEGTL
ncbi:hypothetical protein C8T65DRAFT_745389 [Cerioporus squamosus]|nr:hypothetical protein C8T65DRAFT_745389 [Cerioporus squamosus]